MEFAASIDGSVIDGGFADPVYDAQSVFDAVMNAMARPGTIAKIEQLASAPAPILDTTAALLLTLCDNDTPVWFDVAAGQNSSLSDWIIFQTGAPLADHPTEAHFAILADPTLIPDLATLSQGTQDYPDRSTTLIVQVKNIEASGSLKLEGPGIKGSTTLGLDPLPPFFLDHWAANNARFPRGVDVVFASTDKFVCLPRTTRISKGTA